METNVSCYFSGRYATDDGVLLRAVLKGIPPHLHFHSMLSRVDSFQVAWLDIRQFRGQSESSVTPLPCLPQYTLAVMLIHISVSLVVVLKLLLVQSVSRIWLFCHSHGLQPSRLLYPWYFASKNTGVGGHFLLQGIFLMQGSNVHLALAVRVFTTEPPFYYILFHI